LPGLKALAHVFMEYCDDDMDAFWLFHAFLESQDLLKQDNSERTSRVYSQINQLSRLLRAQDIELFDGLRAKGVELDEFGMRWFRSYFAESLSSSALERSLFPLSFCSTSNSLNSSIVVSCRVAEFWTWSLEDHRASLCFWRCQSCSSSSTSSCT